MVKIFSLGESAITVELADEISPEVNDKVISLANFIEKNGFEGIIEVVPSYTSLTIFFDVYVIRKNFPEFSTAFEAVRNFLVSATKNLTEIRKENPRFIKIPVSFNKEYALDLRYIAEKNNLTDQEVIDIFTAQVYRVYMLGFLPGFAYMGEVDARIATPRKLSPRLKVLPGSVGIGGKQAGIYPLESPGGWQVIGKTDIELFTPNAKNPTFLRAGDLVKFYPQK